MPTAVSRSRSSQSPDRRPLSPRNSRFKALRKRILELLDREIDFIPNASFGQRQTEQELLPPDLHVLDECAKGSAPPRDLPPHLARLCELPLLNERQEKQLFRLMNYCKFRANALRSRLDPDQPVPADVRQIEQLLDISDRIRDHILRANMRLVISIVKKFVVPQYSFDEMLSEGITSLIQAVDKFDYDRGFRFSTYAYRAIARNAYRQVTQRHREQTRVCSISADNGIDVADERRAAGMNVDSWMRLRHLLSDMLDKLDSRERFILEGRFALGDSSKPRTFQSLADELGVSKERVRQLEQRAVLKLQRMADTSQLDQFADCLSS